MIPYAMEMPTQNILATNPERGPLEKMVGTHRYCSFLSVSMDRLRGRP